VKVWHDRVLLHVLEKTSFQYTHVIICFIVSFDEYPTPHSSLLLPAHALSLPARGFCPITSMCKQNASQAATESLAHKPMEVLSIDVARKLNMTGKALLEKFRANSEDLGCTDLQMRRPFKIIDTISYMLRLDQSFPRVPSFFG
jgi:hypothetical protein